MSSALRWLLPLLAAGLLLLVGWWFPPTITIIAGQEHGLTAYNDARHLDSYLGWSDPQTQGGLSARRGTERARFAIPYAFKLGTPLRVELTLSGWGVQNPVTMQINAHRQPVTIREGWREYTLLIPHQPDIYGSDLYLEWRSTGTYGPLLHQITVQPHISDGRFSASLLLLGELLLIMLLARAEPLVPVLMWGSTLAGAALLARLLYAPQLLAYPVLLLLGMLAAIAITALTRHLLHRLVLAGVVAWLLAAPQLLGTWLMDDAFISFRYALNMVQGHGLTFNPNAPPVEGYTNFLWTVLIGGVLACGAEPVVTTQILTTALALATVLLIYRVALHWWNGSAWALLPPLVLAALPPFVLYTARGSGMETALVTLLALLALAQLARVLHQPTLRGGAVAGMLSALVVLTRPDGVLVPLAGGLLLLWQAVRQPQARPALLALIGGFVLLYAPYFVWRYSYYGYLLPNTFYAKTGSSTAQVVRGWHYTREFVLGLQPFALLVLLGGSLLALWRAQPHQRQAAGLLWLFVLLTAVYVTLVGGDQFPLGRFFIVALPPLVLLLTHGASALAQHGRLAQAGAGLACSALLLTGLVGMPASSSRTPQTAVWREHKVAVKNADLGHWLRLNTPPDTVIATGIAGAMPFYAQRHTVDMLGLNDTYIAHLVVDSIGQGVAGAEKTDNTYILDQQPDYIPFASSGTLLADARFRREYELIEVLGPLGGDIKVYRRRDGTLPTAGEQP